MHIWHYGSPNADMRTKLLSRSLTLKHMPTTWPYAKLGDPPDFMEEPEDLELPNESASRSSSTTTTSTMQTHFAAALILLATAFQQRQRNKQPPHTRQTTSTQPSSRQPQPTSTNQKASATPKLDLYASIQQIFHEKAQDPLPALMKILAQGQDIRQARHDKRSRQTTAEQFTTPVTATNFTRPLARLTDPASSPTPTTEPPMTDI